MKTSNSSTFSWLVACVVATVALSLAAAHAPPRMRLIGLFSVAFGLLIGWLLVLLAIQFEAHPSRQMVIGAAVVLSIIGLMGSMWETARLEEAWRMKSGNEGLAARLIEEFEMRTKLAVPDVSNSSPMMVLRRHLSRRVRQLGEWPSPWPEGFWFAELIAAAAAAGWMSRRTLSPDAQSLAHRPAEGP